MPGNMSIGFGNVTGKTIKSSEYVAQSNNPKGMHMTRYLPNGASSVGGAHRQAQVKTQIESNMMISEENDQISNFQKDQIVSAMQRRLDL